MEIEKGSAQVEVIGVFGSVYLYAENGKDIISALYRALSRRKRWNDPDYLARIIFCQMVPEEDWDKSIGYGIGTEMYANIDMIIRVDTTTEELTIQSRSSSTSQKIKATFNSFVNDWTSNAQL